MSKRTIAILSIAGILLNVIAFIGFGPVFSTQLQMCQRTASTNLISCLTSGGSTVDIGFALYVAGTVAAIIAWLVGLIKTAQIGRWGWFVAVLLLSPLGSLLYGLVGPAERKG